MLILYEHIHIYKRPYSSTTEFHCCLMYQVDMLYSYLVGVRVYTTPMNEATRKRQTS